MSSAVRGETWPEFCARIRREPPDVMSAHEVAAYTGVGLNRIWQAIRTGELRHFHPGPSERDARIRRAHVDEWLDSHDHPETALAIEVSKTPVSRLPYQRNRGLGTKARRREVI